MVCTQLDIWAKMIFGKIQMKYLFYWEHDCWYFYLKNT
jgi:hypothetical protein